MNKALKAVLREVIKEATREAAKTATKMLVDKAIEYIDKRTKPDKEEES